MKIRSGFVSNSSASSFVCDICGEIEAGWDGEYDCEVFSCDHHIIHAGCMPTSEGNEISSDQCPICQLKILSSDDELKYLRKIIGLSKDKLLEQIRSKYHNYSEFQVDIK